MIHSARPEAGLQDQAASNRVVERADIGVSKFSSFARAESTSCCTKEALPIATPSTAEP